MGDVLQFDRATFRCSGGELPHGSSEVWAVWILGRGRAHFWVRKAKGHVSVCGVSAPLTISNGQNALAGAGTYPKCKRCMERLRRR